jgi:hypothetical protein
MAIVSLLLCAGITESQAGDPGTVASDPRPVVVFVDPQSPGLDDRQRQILADYRWMRAANPTAKLYVVSLTEIPWDADSRRHLLAETRLAPDQTVFLEVAAAGPIPPAWPDRKPALAATRLN